PNAELLEYCEQDTPIRHDLVPDDIPAIDGYATVPTKPGLGIEVSDEAIEFYRCDNP
ncbi:MAG: mandelate racemase/muconate lactonizing enzyme family protein, partial [Kiritimatiellae bacterium]|nr:mandelate racemase/muconate lactonizing enzyme family protein [Kiritimatiellia bacterium]